MLSLSLAFSAFACNKISTPKKQDAVRCSLLCLLRDDGVLRDVAAAAVLPAGVCPGLRARAGLRACPGLRAAGTDLRAARADLCAACSDLRAARTGVRAAGTDLRTDAGVRAGPCVYGACAGVRAAAAGVRPTGPRVRACLRAGVRPSVLRAGVLRAGVLRLAEPLRDVAPRPGPGCCAVVDPCAPCAARGCLLLSFGLLRNCFAALTSVPKKGRVWLSPPSRGLRRVCLFRFFFVVFFCQP